MSAPTRPPSAVIVGLIFFVLGFVVVSLAVWQGQFLFMAYRHGGL